MRLTLDTNVLVSAFISKNGQPAALLDAILLLPDARVILSEPILNEFEAVLSRAEVRARFQYSIEEVAEVIDQIKRASIMVQITSNFRVVKADPSDDIVINTAWDGQADYIVSGDDHLKKLKKFRGVRIVTPASMLSIIGRKFGEFITGDL